jgi:hypothetical protein
LRPCNLRWSVAARGAMMVGQQPREVIMANARQGSGNGGRVRTSAPTGVMKAEHKHKVVKKPSAEKDAGSDRKEPYPVRQTRK